MRSQEGSAIEPGLQERGAWREVVFPPPQLQEEEKGLEIRNNSVISKIFSVASFPPPLHSAPASPKD